MTITESRRSPARRGTRDLLLGLFAAHRSSVPAAIRPGATVAGPIPRPVDTPDRVICWPLDAASRAQLASRAEKRLIGAASVSRQS